MDDSSNGRAVALYRFSVISDGNSLKFFSKVEKRLKMALKKYFNQLLGACSTLKLVEIHNNIHLPLFDVESLTCFADDKSPLLGTGTGCCCGRCSMDKCHG